MGLFSNPVTLDTDHIFSYRAQLPTSKAGQFAADYIEEAADPSAVSKIVVKHDTSGKTPRHLLQRVINKHPAADTDTDELLPMTINFTVTCAALFSEAEVQAEINILLDAIAQTDFTKKLRSSIL